MTKCQIVGKRESRRAPARDTPCLRSGVYDRLKEPSGYICQGRSSLFSRFLSIQRYLTITPRLVSIPPSGHLLRSPRQRFSPLPRPCSPNLGAPIAAKIYPASCERSSSLGIPPKSGQPCFRSGNQSSCALSSCFYICQCLACGCFLVLLGEDYRSAEAVDQSRGDLPVTAFTDAGGSGNPRRHVYYAYKDGCRHWFNMCCRAFGRRPGLS